MFMKERVNLYVDNWMISGDCPTTASFPCDNQWCIHEELKCDGIDHCGDNSDENPLFVCLPEGEEYFEYLWQLLSALLSAMCFGSLNYKQ